MNFYLQEPTLELKEEAIEYINEHIKYKSNINGSGGLDSMNDRYEEWLEKNKIYANPETCPHNICPGNTYFLMREGSDRIIGMINIRYNLNEALLNHGGHIGYGIRPTERRKGYNKINLYLGLQKSEKLNLEKVLLTADDDNIGSIKTILSLGGILENKIVDEGKLLGRYWIDVKESLIKNKYLIEGSEKNECNRSKKSK